MLQIQHCHHVPDVSIFSLANGLGTINFCRQHSLVIFRWPQSRALGSALNRDLQRPKLGQVNNRCKWFHQFLYRWSTTSQLSLRRMDTSSNWTVASSDPSTAGTPGRVCSCCSCSLGGPRYTGAPLLKQATARLVKLSFIKLFANRYLAVSYLV